MWRVDSLEKSLMLGGIEAGGEEDDREWDGWMASLTRWTWVWVNSRSWWWIRRPGVLQFVGSQRVGHDWATELNWIWASFPGSVGKESACSAGNLGSIPGSGRSLGEGNGNPLQSSALETDWWASVHEVAKSWTRLSNWTELNWIKIHIGLNNKDGNNIQ